VPASLPLANVTLDPGQQLLFSIPPVPALSRYVQLWLTFGKYDNIAAHRSLARLPTPNMLSTC